MRYHVEIYKDGRWVDLKVSKLVTSGDDPAPLHHLCLERSGLYPIFSYRLMETVDGKQVEHARYQAGKLIEGAPPHERTEPYGDERGDSPMEEVRKVEIVFHYADDAGAEKSWRFSTMLGGGEDGEGEPLLAPMLRLAEAMIPWAEKIRELREAQGHEAVSRGDAGEASAKSSEVLAWLQSGEILSEIAALLAVRLGKEPS